MYPLATPQDRGCPTFSRAGYSPWYRYRHRRLNPLVHKLLVGKGSIRGIARHVKIHRDTVSRRLQILAMLAREEIRVNQAHTPLATHVQLDDLITFEHSKLKQVSVTLIKNTDQWPQCEKSSRKIRSKARSERG